MNRPAPVKLESEILLMEHSNTMHIWLLNIAIVYSILFSVFSFYLDDYPQAIITFTAFPLALISLFFYKKKHKMLSKVINMLQLILVITFLCLVTGNGSFAFMYYFPLLIAALIVFKGKHKKFGYGFVVLSMILLIIVTYLDLRLGIKNYEPDHQKEDQLSNIVGVCLACILLFAFSIKSTDIIQQRLIEKAREVQIKNEQLASSVYTRDKMMSVISHDLRSPIIALNSAMNVFTEQEIDPTLQKEIVGQLKIKSNKVLILIDELLNWTKTQSMAIEVNTEKLEMNHIINYIKEHVESLGEQKSISIELINNSIAEYIMADKNMIEAIFRNLISNAVKFSSVNNKIQVTITDVNNHCEFSFRDFGKGMTEKEVANFKKGISFSTAGTANEKGHGLGLQLVKEFLHKQQSELYLESHSGFGSRFYFSLPIAD